MFSFVLFFRFICIYPAFINSKKTIAEGRRIPTEKVKDGCVCVCVCVSFILISTYYTHIAGMNFILQYFFSGENARFGSVGHSCSTMAQYLCVLCIGVMSCPGCPLPCAMLSGISLMFTAALSWTGDYGKSTALMI